MEEECYCNSFDRKVNSFSKFLKTFEIITSSKLKEEKYGEVTYTAVLKCKKCKSHYLWDSYSQIYSEKDLILERKYIPNVDDSELKKILFDAEGVIDERRIEKCSQLLNKLKKIELKRDYQTKVNENKSQTSSKFFSREN